MNSIESTDEVQSAAIEQQKTDVNCQPLTAVNLVWQVDTDGLIEKDWIDFLFSDFSVKHIHDRNLEVVVDCAIVITRGYPEAGISVKEYLQRFKQKGYAVGVLHLSDEWFTAPIDFYPDADFVLRNYYRPDVAHLSKVRFVPLGYKQGLHQQAVPKDIGQRQYCWSFAGQLGGKVSRRSMLNQARKIAGGIDYVGEGYNDSKDLSFAGYVDLICDTVFVLSPAGNRCAETSRFYEALEVGAIPIVEDVSKLNVVKQILKEVLSPAKAKRHKAWTLRYWQESLARLFESSYWLQVYGPDFPCPRCSDWSQLKTTLDTTEVEQTSKQIQTFWQAYKQNLKRDIRNTIMQNFSGHEVDTPLAEVDTPSAEIDS